MSGSWFLIDPQAVVGENSNLQWFEVFKVYSGTDDRSGANIESRKVPNARNDVTIKPTLIERVG
jgi:hypothetical protein